MISHRQKRIAFAVLALSGLLLTISVKSIFEVYNHSLSVVAPKAGSTSPSSVSLFSAPQSGAVILGTAYYRGLGHTPLDISRLKDFDEKVTALSWDLVTTSGGTLANALIYIKRGFGPMRFRVSLTKAVMNATPADFYPHILGVQVGQRVVFRNASTDPCNWTLSCARNNSVSFGLPLPGMEKEHRFTAQEIPVVVRDRLYPWMSAYICVLSNPFFSVTGFDGAFHLEGMPSGVYVIECWHEKLGRIQQTVTLREGETREIVFTYAEKNGQQIDSSLQDTTP